MKDKTRKIMDELNHVFVKDALEHALKMKYALMQIVNVLGPEAPNCEGCSVEIREALKIADRAIKNL
jgi:hypothetical protein